MNLPNDKQQLLKDITGELKRIEGVKAIVLGGSHATGMATDSSDLDIGIYYNEQNPFDIEKIKCVAQKIAANEPPIVTAFYEWGPWVNGGAWIKTTNGKVDFLYKNIRQVTKTIANATNGTWENHFEQQPPYGFSSIIFLAETHICIPLYDPENVIAALKESVKQYPPKLKQNVIQQSLWSAEFTIWQANGFAAKQDAFNSMGCFTRAAKNIVTALFAINEMYPLGDKRAIEILEHATIKPENFASKIDEILCCNKQRLADNVMLLRQLFDQTEALAGGAYKPYYKL